MFSQIGGKECFMSFGFYTVTESLNTVFKLVRGLTAFVSTLEILLLSDAERRIGSRRPEKDHSAPGL